MAKTMTKNKVLEQIQDTFLNIGFVFEGAIRTDLIEKIEAAQTKFPEIKNELAEIIYHILLLNSDTANGEFKIVDEIEKLKE